MVVYLRGGLGAGKTTLVRGVLNALGYTGRVKSPTYTLLESYQVGGLDLRHFDLYRMNNDEEWESAGFRDEYNGRNILFIEWPDQAASLLPPPDLVITLEISASGRQAELIGYSDIGRACIGNL